MNSAELIKRIKKIKKEKNMLILAHLYQLPEIQDLADFVGDSLDLSRKAKEAKEKIIVFCGVKFMAETAKILNPDKTVLLPVESAGCPMADMIGAEELDRLKKAHPEAAVVCYVNSGVDIKAKSDICCTSSNAVAAVRSLSETEIIFVPDRNLGHFVAQRIPEKKFFFSEGFCPVHEALTPEHINKARSEHPNALFLVHPEARPDVVAMSDFAGSTSQIISYACESDKDEFIIGTESGILHKLGKTCPEKKFYTAKENFVCGDMKETDLQSLYHSLTTLTHVVEVDKDVAAAALKSIDRMLKV